MDGIEVMGAVVNLRDLGPLIGGLLGGPTVGFSAALMGVAYRIPLGGITLVSCAASTILAGLIGGLIHTFRKGRLPGIGLAACIAALVEAFHMGFTLLISRPFDAALEIVQRASLPMILVNALGLGIFTYILRNLRNERAVIAAQEKMASELKIARDIQMSMVPKIFPPLPEHTEFDLYAALAPAREVGGDFYDFFMRDNRHLYFAVGDVSGKGVPASLFMAVAKTLLEARGHTGSSPSEILHHVNNELCRENEAGMFVTVFLGVLDICTGELRYCSGGHPMPWLAADTGALRRLEKTGGIALGVSPGMSFTENRIKMQNGECLFVYTDGGDHTIVIRLSRRDDLLDIEIADDGVAFDPLQVTGAETAKPLEERQLGGLGIHLVKHLADNIHYQRAGNRNILNLEKRLGPE